MDEQQLENRLTRLEESLDYIGEDIEGIKGQPDRDQGACAVRQYFSDTS